MKSILSQQSILFVGLLFLFSLAVGSYLFVRAHDGIHSVVLTEDGYSPASIVIKEGDTVVFSSEIDEPYWPASNVHPTHSIYEAFDPKRPVAPDETWSFVFSKPGIWKYHDHLNPSVTGSITVRSSRHQEPITQDNCEEQSGSQKIQCFERVLEEILMEKGVEEAFQYFVQIYNADPEVPVVCHGWAHRLGEVEYGRYKAGEEVTLRPEATFCSYGYFHGFISAMVEDTHSLESALQFCEKTNSRGRDGLQNLHNNCVHGIGHSISTLYLENGGYWGDFEKVMGEGFRQCEGLYEKGPDRNICFDGMFHELHFSVIQNTYGMSKDTYIQTGDMFHYCHPLGTEHKESCYYDFITLWPYFFSEDKKAAMEYVLATMENPEENGTRAMRTFGRSFIEADIQKGNYQTSVDACAIATGTLHDVCVSGLTTGFVEHGEPGNMHDEGFAFCREHYDGQEEKDCIGHMIRALSWSYTEENMNNACASLGEDERPLSCT